MLLDALVPLGPGTEPVSKAGHFGEAPVIWGIFWHVHFNTSECCAPSNECS